MPTASPTWPAHSSFATAKRLRIRVELVDVVPPVWRALDVPASATLAQLHAALQAAMGWADVHLHGFARTDFWADGPARRFLPDDSVDAGEEGRRESSVQVGDLMKELGDSLVYLYDYGDGWEHTLRLEAVGPPPADPAIGTPFRLVDGARAGPPEDCGGVPGYEGLRADASRLNRGLATQDPDARESLDWHYPGLAPGQVLAAMDRFDLSSSARIVASLGRARPTLSAPLEEMVNRAWDRRPLQALIALANLPESASFEWPDRATASRITAPYAWFIRHVGVDGVALTSAGYLRPTDVEAVAAELNLAGEWIGTRNREATTYPVLAFRECAQALGLVRKVKGRLTTTRAARALAADPEGLFAHIADRLPLEKAVARHDAGLVMLLEIAGLPTNVSTPAGGKPTGLRDPDSPGPAATEGDDARGESPSGIVYAAQRRREAAMASLGWAHRDGRTLDHHAIALAAELTRTVLDRASALGRSTRGARGSLPLPDGVVLARAALLGARPL
ncbi:plasmid pRiA4b ORF-3 family protein [Oerskovia turbata]|uniref:plasmid pRiA4b ORF-3 family protein n=1 Tax=Oerskovia turbata TaxID=1713 RepID=UPI000A7EEF57|nr:plasmid pRiA4b ORF-3 family protein [Oerskovia turbata]